MTSGAKKLICAAAMMACAGPVSAETSHAHWSYDGDHGPSRWAELEASYSSCAGSEQSPIDLNGQAIPAAVHAPAVYWKEADVTSVTNNGHTFQVDLSDAGKIVIDDVPYHFLQFHFHSGSEHTFHGRRFPLEVHLVHQSADGRLAVIGVMFAQGEHNPLLDDLINVMPGAPGSLSPIMKVNLNDFLPGDWSAYRYEGSLTTPPCSEIVAWTVFEKPLSASADQFAVFETLFPHSYRPVQPQNRRFVLKTD
tara:strand:+ start:3963 stop:4715 length:753 start_codon:yes stop_codon:yes gene_type:complete